MTTAYRPNALQWPLSEDQVKGLDDILEDIYRHLGPVTDGHQIDATLIGDGSVDNAEFGYLDGVTSAIQTQLDAKPEQAQVLARVFLRT